MQADNFDKFSYRRTWLLIRREILMLTLRDYFMIFFMSLLPIMFPILFVLWSGTDIDILRTDGLSLYIPTSPIIYITYIFYITISSDISPNLKPDRLKILPHLLLKEMFPARITEIILAEFICFAVLFPLVQIILLLLPFIVFHFDFFIWLIMVEIILSICSSLLAFMLFIDTAIKNIPILRYQPIQLLAMIIISGGVYGWIFLLPKESIPLLLHYIVAVEVVITAILLWATYRIRSKNASR